MHSIQLEPSQVAVDLPRANNHSADMPPPPLLDLNPVPTASEVADNVSSSVVQGKKPRVSKGGSAIGVGNTPPVTLSDATAPKRCGRPLGSKNKPKT
jgi:hypothetical protein